MNFRLFEGVVEAVVAEREFLKSLSRAFARSLATSLVLRPDWFLLAVLLYCTVLHCIIYTDLSGVVFLIINKKFVSLNSIPFKRNHFNTLFFYISTIHFIKIRYFYIIYNSFVSQHSILKCISFEVWNHRSWTVHVCAK